MTKVQNLSDVARRFREGELVEKGKPQHATMAADSKIPPTVGGFLPGPSRIVSVKRRRDGQWDIEFVQLVEAGPSDS